MSACTLHHGGKFYNLNPLSDRTDYVLKSLGGHEFILNVCRSVSHETWALKVPNPADVGGFIRLDRGDFSVGSVSSTNLSIRGSSPVLQLTSGSACSTNSRLTGSTAIQFICDRQVFGSGSPTLIAQLPPADEDACAFFLEWHTPFACPTSESRLWTTFLTVLLSLIVVFLILYFVCGTLYNRFVLKLTGFDQVPRCSLIAFNHHFGAMWEIACDTLHLLYRNLQDFCLGAVVPRAKMGANLGVSHHWTHGNDIPSLSSAPGGHGGLSLVQNVSTSDEQSTGRGMDPNGIIRLYSDITI